MCHEKTIDEVRQDFIDSVRQSIKYWAALPNKTDEERCEGTAHSILSIIDGCSGMPGFDLVVYPHPEDKSDAIENGYDYYPERPHDLDDWTISGDLHELILK